MEIPVRIDAMNVYIGHHPLERWRERMGRPHDGIEAVRRAVSESEPMRRKELLRFLAAWCVYGRLDRGGLTRIAREEAERGRHWRIWRPLGVAFLMDRQRRKDGWALVTCALVEDVRQRARVARTCWGE